LTYPHRPVLVNQVVRTLLTVPDGIYVDGTAGTGGHSEAIGRAMGAEGRLLCLDRDSEALRICRNRLFFLGDRVTLVQGNYAAADDIIRNFGLEAVHGMLLDLGMSSYQLEQSGRGFSFNRDEPLDMRMDPGSGITAEQLINSRPSSELEKILREFGEEKRAKVIARSIVQKRPLSSSLQLARLIEAVVPRSRRGRKHPATRTFQALRIAVNRELEYLRTFLEKAPSLIVAGGRLVVLSYHSLEDRMVKQAMADWERGCQCPPNLPECRCGKSPLFRRLQKKGIKPDHEEIEQNPRARSAMLRVAERI
jgi:16S rRNA (cytosine1402-N4)-methyltransferase